MGSPAQYMMQNHVEVMVPRELVVISTGDTIDMSALWKIVARGPSSHLCSEEPPHEIDGDRDWAIFMEPGPYTVRMRC
ncbi:unnamed protein product [Agarophyton chilense]